MSESFWKMWKYWLNIGCCTQHTFTITLLHFLGHTVSFIGKQNMLNILKWYHFIILSNSPLAASSGATDGHVLHPKAAYANCVSILILATNKMIKKHVCMYMNINHVPTGKEQKQWWDAGCQVSLCTPKSAHKHAGHDYGFNNKTIQTYCCRDICVFSISSWINQSRFVESGSCSLLTHAGKLRETVLVQMGTSVWFMPPLCYHLPLNTSWRACFVRLPQKLQQNCS